MTESQLSEHFPDLFRRIYLLQKHSETVAGVFQKFITQTLLYAIIYCKYSRQRIILNQKYSVSYT